ncbi:glycosyltransferase family 4 protein [Halosimplex sp. TS25]|uniref:glycosyltransferase family 4 protein n=1 Tax=Halosimplex rarum TaxID=3396619 RepID=UPI0039E983B7
MRILRVAQTVYPDVKGGGAYHVHALSRDQAAMGHEVTLVTIRRNSGIPAREERAGYTIRRYDPAVTLLGNEISPRLAKSVFDTTGYDVVHAHSHLYFSTNVAALKRRLGDTPLAITNHGLYSQTAPERVFDYYLRTLGRWTFNRADVVFCYTDTDRQRLREFGVSTHINVIPNGIDTSRFCPDGSTSEHIDSDGPALLFVGRLISGKRPELAVEALAAVRESHPEAVLYICGDGPLRADLSDRANELGVSRGVQFLGHVPYEKMPAVFRSGDVLLLPSRAEGLPRTVLEAIACGVPVVCSHLDQLEAVVSGRGTLVNGTEPTEFAEAVREWLDDGTVDPLGGEHTWATTVDRTTEQLKSLCS